MTFNQIEQCRNCKGEHLADVIDLGLIYPSDFVVSETSSDPAPLKLVRCETCDLVQLEHTVDLDMMYREYWYKSSLNAGMVESLRDVVSSVMSEIDLQNQDVVVDIGCNDGTMLEMYPDYVLKVGYDPALNLADESRQRGVHLYSDYFNAESYVMPKAKVVTAIAMFYDLPDPNAFLQDVDKIMLDDGLLVIQFTDLLSMLKLNAFDNICHEHLEYYSFSVLESILANNGFTIYHTESNNVNGGSVRVYAKKSSHASVPRASVGEYRAKEQHYLNKFDDPYQAFADRVSYIGLKIKDFFENCKKQGKKVYGMGASTKGNTLLQYYLLNNTDIPYIAEVSADKFGRKTIATNIEIIPESDAIAMEPEYFFILPWHFVDNILEKSGKALDAGIKFVTPLPELTVYFQSGSELIKIEI